MRKLKNRHKKKMNAVLKERRRQNTSQARSSGS